MITDLKTKKQASSHGIQKKVTAQLLIDFGKYRGWEFVFLGKEPVPEKPVRKGDWVAVPPEMDNTPYPNNVYEKMLAIQAANLEPKLFLLVHYDPEKPREMEVAPPKVLPATQSEPKDSKLGLGSLFVAAGAFAVGIKVLFGLLAAAMFLVDPILVAITEDDEWVEIDRWYC